MKTLAVSILLGTLLAATAAYADRKDDKDNDRNNAKWELPEDMLVTSNQISFNQGANDVWYFMESKSLIHDPTTYSFLPSYTAPCDHGPHGLGNGEACWESDHTTDNNPKAGVNFTEDTHILVGVIWPPRSFLLHPAPDRFAIVAWKSSIEGVIEIKGSFTKLDESCGNGVLWFIDKGNTTLAHGDLPASGKENFYLNVNVRPGEVLYFIVDPKGGDYNCDSTGPDITIRTKGRSH